MGAVFCAASCCCSVMSCCCGMPTDKGSVVSRISYAVQLIIIAFVAWIMKGLPDWLQEQEWWTTALEWIPGLDGCPAELCYGNMSAYRITAGLGVFHLIMMIIMINVKRKSDPRTGIQNGWFALKFPLILAFSFLFFFIPNEIFVYYGWVALFGSGFFILIQLILLIDFAHTWNEKWVENFEVNGTRIWAILLLGCTFGFYILSIVGSILMYVWFTDNPNGCWANSFFITVNLILCFGFSMFSIYPKIQEKNPKSSLLTSSIVTAYCTYLVWSALLSQPADLKCSSFNTTDVSWSTYVGIGITFFSVLYAALRVSHSDLHSTEDEGVDEERKNLMSVAVPDAYKEEVDSKVQYEETILEGDEEEISSSIAEDDTPGYNYSYFHFTFFLASLYLCMVLTNWYINHISEETNTIVVDQGIISVWVKIISSWCTIALYVWTILAPILFPHRFGFDQF